CDIAALDVRRALCSNQVHTRVGDRTKSSCIRKGGWLTQHRDRLGGTQGCEGASGLVQEEGATMPSLARVLWSWAQHAQGGRRLVGRNGGRWPLHVGMSSLWLTAPVALALLLLTGGANQAAAQGTISPPGCRGSTIA